MLSTVFLRGKPWTSPLRLPEAWLDLDSVSFPSLSCDPSHSHCLSPTPNFLLNSMTFFSGHRIFRFSPVSGVLFLLFPCLNNMLLFAHLIFSFFRIPCQRGLTWLCYLEQVFHTLILFLCLSPFGFFYTTLSWIASSWFLLTLEEVE